MQSEYTCRRFEQSKDTSNRMDSEQFSDTDTFSGIGHTSDRFVCLRSKSQGRNILLMDPQSNCMGNRCSVSTMAERGCICIPSNISKSESTTAHEEVPVPIDSDCAPVADETLVHGSSSDVGSRSKEASHDEESIVSTQNNDCSSKSSSF